MGDLVELIVDKYDGSLKAEHGTGLNMAPYVEREWGAKATEMMWRIKALADPAGVLAPGVLLNRDPGVHLRNLKSAPPIEEVADTCVECGFCEPVCPSRHLTTTPAAANRAAPRDGAPAGRVAGAARAARRVRVRRARDVRRGRHVHARVPARNRHRQAREGAARARSTAARGAVRADARRGAGRRCERGARAGLRVGAPLRGATRAAAGGGQPRAGARLAGRTCRARRRRAARPRAREGAAAVYLPACVNRIFGHARGAERTSACRRRWSRSRQRAGLPVWIPPDVAGHCCGDALELEGLPGRATRTWRPQTLEALWDWTDEGSLPVVIDASSCALGADRGRRTGDRASRATRSRGRTTGCCRS